MLDRYSPEEMSQLWSLEAQYQAWLDIELAVCNAYEQLGKIPAEANEHIQEAADFDLEGIAEIEKTTHHDLIAFTTNLANHIDAGNDLKYSRFVHLGLTSNDIKDSGQNLQIQAAASLINQDAASLLETLEDKSLEYKDLVCIGRSHGVHAEATTFGLKLLGYFDDIRRSLDFFNMAADELNTLMLSGAVGTYGNIDPKIEEIVAEELEMMPTAHSTQVIARDKHAHLLNSMAVFAGCIENIGVEIRHLQRTEVLEVEEPFHKGQKGSSAMPHKRNPWRSENLSGLARMMRGYAAAAMENIPLWHERDMSHSSAERITLPDAFALLDFMLLRINGILSGLEVYPENMKANLNKFGGVSFSQKVLLKLVDSGLSREEAYAVVQELAHQAWNSQGSGFKELVQADTRITDKLSAADIEACFDPQQDLKNIDAIYDKVLAVDVELEEEVLA